ncbi:thioredoxin [Patescibacteria group bacterium]|nr:thioredoxin [Patescibacteria group bacterium]
MSTVYTQDTFASEVLEKKGVVLIDFFAVWCGPCQMIAPIIDEIATEFEGRAGVGKVDVDASPDIAGKYGVMSIPTIIIFKDGEEFDKMVGAASKEKIVEAINKALA